MLSSAPKNGLKGEITIPPDKSISHRSLIIGALTKGKIRINNFSSGEDCRSTLKIMNQLGVKVDFLDDSTLLLDAESGLSAPNEPLDCGNSGTTMRLMSGILAGQPFNSVLFGDESLSKRPMRRVIEPLSAMGAHLESSDGRPPLKIFGRELKGIEYHSQISSAQVKSCVLLAGLNAQGTTFFKEPVLSRDHTERMLEYLGAKIERNGTEVKIYPSALESKDLTIVGDISSAAFFLIMGAIVKNSEITIKNVGLNPTRTGILDVLKNMGADIEILNEKSVCNEPVGDVKIKYSDNLCGIEISGEIIPRLIDELPAIAVLATQAQGATVVKDAGDLRNKESDRIKAVVGEMKKMGADIVETEDGFIIQGSSLRGGCEVEVYHDHRLAMSWFLAGLVSKEPVQINGFSWANTSFPEFLGLFGSLVL